VFEALGARVGEPTRAELPGLLDWDGVRRLRDLGFTIGAHGITHSHFPLCDDATLQAELVEPRKVLARELGVSVDTVAFPAGRYDARVLAAVEAAGYKSAITTEVRNVRPGDHPLRLGRKMLSEEHGTTPDLVAAQLADLFGALGLTRAIPGDQGLNTPWL
jgi:peptidoglycan/xylan/chitin deacetylase (PgdA/CDA1 family)